MRFISVAVVALFAVSAHVEPLPLRGPILPLAKLALYQISVIPPGGVANGASLTATQTFTGVNTFSGSVASSSLVANNLTLSQFNSPSNPVVTPQGTTGATTYGYRVVALASDGLSSSGSSGEGTTATGNATLDGTNFNRITWTATTDATGKAAASYDVYRTTGGAAPPKRIATALAALTLDDTGIAGTATIPPFAGSTGASSGIIGTTTSNTNATAFPFKIFSGSTGTPANGIGAGVRFIVETSENKFTPAGTIEAVSTDVTLASEDFDFVVKTAAAGAAPAERLRISSTGSVFSTLIQTGGDARVTSDITNATTTFANITGLTANVVSARKYAGRVVLRVDNSLAADGIKLDFNGGSATMTSFWAACHIDVGGAAVAVTQISTSLAGVINWSTITGDNYISCDVSFVPSSTSTFIMRQAGNAAVSGTLTTRVGTYWDIHDIP